MLHSFRHPNAATQGLQALALVASDGPACEKQSVGCVAAAMEVVPAGQAVGVTPSGQ